ncbi:MAG: tyrosine-type recombinase/integrase [Bryobacteraceae bacterium]
MGLRNMRGKWQYRFTIAGEKVSFTTDLPATDANREAAEAMEAAHRRKVKDPSFVEPVTATDGEARTQAEEVARLVLLKIDDGRWARPVHPRTFGEAVGDFLDWCRVEYQAHPNTWLRIRASMRSAEIRFGKQMIPVISAGEIESYKVWRLLTHQVRPVTLKHDLDSLSLFFQWAIKSDFARLNPLEKVSRPSDADAVRQKVLSEAEEKLYFEHASGDLAKVTRLILLQGMRPEEVVRLRWEDVDLAAGVLHVRQGKTKAAKRTLRLTTESAQILAGQMSATSVPAWSRGRSPWVFPSPRKPGAPITKLNNPHNRVCKEAGLFCVIYDFRHTFATRLAATGVDAFAIAAILGHASVRLVSRYVHPQQAQMDSAMRVYDQRNEERRQNDGARDSAA